MTLNKLSVWEICGLALLLECLTCIPRAIPGGLKKKYLEYFCAAPSIVMIEHEM